MTLPPGPPAPPPMPQPAVPANDRTTLFGVLGIIGAVCCPILGIIFGFLCLSAARKAGKSPTLAYIAIVLSIVGAITGAILTANGTVTFGTR